VLLVAKPVAVFLSKILLEVQLAVLTAAVILSRRATPAGLPTVRVVLTSGAARVLIAASRPLKLQN